MDAFAYFNNAQRDYLFAVLLMKLSQGFSSAIANYSSEFTIQTLNRSLYWFQISL